MPGGVKVPDLALASGAIRAVRLGSWDSAGRSMVCSNAELSAAGMSGRCTEWLGRDRVGWFGGDCRVLGGEVVSCVGGRGMLGPCGCAGRLPAHKRTLKLQNSCHEWHCRARVSLPLAAGPFSSCYRQSLCSAASASRTGFEGVLT